MSLKLKKGKTNLKQGGTYTNPRPGQYLTHAYSHITRAVAAVDSSFALIGAHQRGIAVRVYKRGKSPCIKEPLLPTAKIGYGLLAWYKLSTPFEPVLAIKGSIPSPSPLGSVSSLECLDAPSPSPPGSTLSWAFRETHKGIIGRRHDLRLGVNQIVDHTRKRWLACVNQTFPSCLRGISIRGWTGQSVRENQNGVR